MATRRSGPISSGIGRGSFPGWADQSACVRQAANLWQKQLPHERFVTDSGAYAAAGHIVDGFPIAVCELARAVLGHALKAEADCGAIGAAKAGYYHGLKVYLLIDLRGVVVGVTLAPANVDERDAAHDLPSVNEGLVLGEKGLYLSPSSKRIAKRRVSICKCPRARTGRNIGLGGG